MARMRPIGSIRRVPSASVVSVCLLTAICLLSWCPRLQYGLSLDETGSFWVIKDSLAETIARAQAVQGQSAFYYVILWGVHRLGGDSELVLRLPSLTFVLLSLTVVFYVTRRLAGPQAGAYAVALFASTRAAGDSAVFARPYGLAMLAVVLALACCARWAKRRDIYGGLGAMLFSMLAFVAHYIVGGILFLCLGIWQLALSVRNPRTLRVLPAMLVAAGAASVMLWPQLSSLVSRGGQLSFKPCPTPLDLAGALVSAPMCLLLLGLFIFRQQLVHDEQGEFHGAYTFLSFLFVLAVVPPIAVYLVSISWKSLWVERYYAENAVAVSILGAWALSKLHERAALLTLGLVVLCASALELKTGGARREGWREAVQAVRSDQSLGDCSLLFSSGFIETASSSAFSQPTLADFVRAPLYYYRLELPIVDLPLHLAGEADRQYFSTAVAPVLDRTTCVVIMARTMYFWDVLGNYVPAHLAIEQALAKRGFRRLQESSFLNITVSHFRRGADIQTNHSEEDQGLRPSHR